MQSILDHQNALALASAIVVVNVIIYAVRYRREQPTPGSAQHPAFFALGMLFIAVVTSAFALARAEASPLSLWALAMAPLHSFAGLYGLSRWRKNAHVSREQKQERWRAARGL